MEINEDIHDPESNFENLVHQVEEQSEFCDVTVRFGDWARKFHRCVLSASVLFQTVINARFAETVTGNGDAFADTLPVIKLEMKIDTSPDVVETAIMSMYGIIPDLNIINIGDFLELSEYLEIEELKETCVDWLNDIDYSEVNCVHVILLSRKHKFDITPCIEYIESHIPGTFLHADAVDLPTDLVEDFFTDVKFSYVDMDDKLNFLVKLANKIPTWSVEEIIVKLFKKIDLTEVSQPAWDYAKSDVNFSGIVNLGNKLRPINHECSRKCLMIIPSQEDYFACLNLQNDSWYRLNSSYFEEYSHDEQEFLGIRNNSSEVYFKDRCFYFDYLALTSVDLESDQIRRYLLSMEYDCFHDGAVIHEETMHVNFRNNTLIATVKKTIRMFKSSAICESEPESEPNCRCAYHEGEEERVNKILQARVPTEIIPDTSVVVVPYMVQTRGICTDEPSTSSSKLSTLDCEQYRQIEFTEVYIGDASEDEVDMQPLFSLRQERIAQICMNDQSVMALLTESGGRMHVILYDLLQFKMERMPVQEQVQERKYELCATDNGFLLHNNIHFYCLTKAAGPIFSGNYKIEEFKLENKEDWLVKYHYQGGFWMRILRRSKHNETELQYISHEDLTVCHSSLDVNWRNVSMPKDKYCIEEVKNFENIFIVSLSKRKLRCNIACPHCKYLYCSEFY